MCVVVTGYHHHHHPITKKVCVSDYCKKHPYQICEKGNKISKLCKDESRLYWQVFALHPFLKVLSKVCQTTNGGVEK